MDYLAIILMIFCTIKSIFYAKYEFSKNENVLGSFIILFISILGLVINSCIIIF